MLDILLNTLIPQEGALIPLAVLALLISSAIVSIWYMIGLIINDNRIKASAIGEFTQMVGTLILIAIVIYSLTVLSAALYTSLNSTKLMSQSAISTICSKLESTSQLSILGTGTGSLLSSTNSQYPGICYYINSISGSGVNTRIDYPLAAAAVVDANVTNQIATQLNNLFVVDAYVGFYSSFKDIVGIGVGIPIVSAGVTPDLGFGMIYDSMKALGALTSLGLEANMAALIILTISLYAWPYLIFGGIVLRTTIFTRRIGGLLIAIGIGIVFIYPTVLSIEYLTLSNPSSYAQLNAYSNSFGPTVAIAPGPIDSNSILLSSAMQSTYKLDFFILPDISKIASQDGCWPPGGYLIAGEASQMAISLVPIVSQLNLIVAFTGGSIPDVNIGFSSCSASSAQSLIFDLFDFYGIGGIIMYWIPIINIIITLVGILGLSGLMGGDTNLAGFGRLI